MPVLRVQIPQDQVLSCTDSNSGTVSRNSPTPNTDLFCPSILKRRKRSASLPSRRRKPTYMKSKNLETFYSGLSPMQQSDFEKIMAQTTGRKPSRWIAKIGSQKLRSTVARPLCASKRILRPKTCISSISKLLAVLNSLQSQKSFWLHP